MLAACASPVVVRKTTPVPPPTATQMNSIRTAHIQARPGGLRIHLLHSPAVDALLNQAEEDLEMAHYASAAKTLDHARKANPNAPDLLQARAEAALGLGHMQAAAGFLSQAIQNVPANGALCVRIWQTAWVLRTQQHNPTAAAQALIQRQACAGKLIPAVSSQPDQHP